MKTLTKQNLLCFSIKVPLRKLFKNPKIFLCSAIFEFYRSISRLVAWLLGPLFTFSVFLSFLSVRLLPRCPGDLLQHCSYPPACNWGSCVSSLVKISPPVELNCSICKGTSLPKLMIYSRLYLDQIWAILLGFGPLCLELGHFAQIWAILLGFGVFGRIRVRIGP